MKKILVLMILVVFMFVIGCSNVNNTPSPTTTSTELPHADIEDLEPVIEDKKDEHGCLIAAGYQWCESTQMCSRNWEEECPGQVNGKMLKSEAINIAKATEECSDYLTNEAYRNKNTNTWWIEMNLEKEGCNPACVVDEVTKTAEINWRCTGLVQ